MDTMSETGNAYELCSELISRDDSNTIENSNATSDIDGSRKDIQYATTALLEAKNRPTPQPHTPHSMITNEEDSPNRPKKGRNLKNVIPGRRKQNSRNNRTKWKRPINKSVLY